MSTLYQYSHFLAVSAGFYDGDLSIESLKTKGRYGLGTFNQLDGELVVIDGEHYHCQGGCVRKADLQQKLPWAAVADIDHQQAITVSRVTSLKKLEQFIVDKVGVNNYPIALYIKARVKKIVLGSVPKQKPPYRPIAEVIEDSVSFDVNESQVEISGFYAPQFLFPIKSQGLHLHFVDEERKVGGHILEMELMTGELSYQLLDGVNVILPKTKEYAELNLTLTNDQSNELPRFSDKLAETHDM